MDDRQYVISTITCGDSEKVTIHSGEFIQFLLIKSGSGFFQQSDKSRRCGIQELIMQKTGTALTLTCSASSFPLELVSIRFSRQILEKISRDGLDLPAYFSALPGDCVIVTAEDSLMMIAKNLISDLIKQEKSPELGDSIYRGGLLFLIVALFARAFQQKTDQKQKGKTKAVPLDSLLSYIREHITEELPLGRLEQEFNVSRRHILREFKKGTGQTVHAYIIRTKLSLCKKYIEDGVAINQVYKKAGFGGYSHFFRAFKKEFHMTPGEYYRNFCNEKEKSDV